MKIASEKEMLQFGQEFAKKHILSKSPLIIELTTIPHLIYHIFSTSNELPTPITSDGRGFC